ncbi:MAG: DUF6265 family protein [Planctomycetota bacterium]
MSRPLLAASLLCVLVVALASRPAAAADAPPDLAGAWAFAEDLTGGEAANPPAMGRAFEVAREGAATVVRWPHPHPRTHRFADDGAEEATTDGATVSRHRGRFDGATWVLEATDETTTATGKVTTVSRRVLTRDGDALRVELTVTAPTARTIRSKYVRPEALPKPTAARADLAAVAWLSGTWTGALGRASLEERWGPATGGAMLATSKTVAGGRMVEFEYLRIVERDGGLVYVAQPGGRPPTEFVATAVDATSATFENPSHDFPQRIRYALGTDGVLTAEIGDLAGKRRMTFTFRKAE